MAWVWALSGPLVSVQRAQAVRPCRGQGASQLRTCGATSSGASKCTW